MSWLVLIWALSVVGRHISLCKLSKLCVEYVTALYSDLLHSLWHFEWCFYSPVVRARWTGSSQNLFCTIFQTWASTSNISRTLFEAPPSTPYVRRILRAIDSVVKFLRLFFMSDVLLIFKDCVCLLWCEISQQINLSQEIYWSKSLNQTGRRRPWSTILFADSASCVKILQDRIRPFLIRLLRVSRTRTDGRGRANDRTKSKSPPPAPAPIPARLCSRKGVFEVARIHRLDASSGHAT